MGASLEIRPSYPEQNIVVVTDLDDCAFDRGLFTREVGRRMRSVLPHKLSKRSVGDFTELDHTPIDRPVRGLEAISAFFHFRRKPIEGVIHPLRDAIASGIPVIAATGRRAKTRWDKGTRDQADRAGLNFTDIILTPDGVSGKVSKAKTIKRVGATHYLDDDPDTIQYVNRENPGLQIIHIDHGHHLSKEYLSKNPNITVIPAAQLHRKRQVAKEGSSGVSETRNSTLREGVATPIQAITRLVHRVFPWLTPTHLNILGAAEVVIGAVIAAIRDPRKLGGEKGKTAAAATLITKGSVMDAFDGALARLMAAEDPNTVDFKKGSIFDAISDRVQEVALAFSRAWSAAKRGGKLGWVSSVAALATAVTSFGPSLSRALSEFFGKPVPESGKGISGLIGTRPGRAFLGTLATLYPEPKGIPAQLGVDLMLTGSNFLTTVDRLRTAFGSSEATLSQTVRDEAKTRLKVLGGLGAFALASSVLTYWILSKRRNQEQPEARREIDLMNVISGLERYCKEQGLEHRFVGGTFTDFIGPQTKFAIDISKKTVTLVNPNKPALIRSDETVKDIDMVVYTPDQSKLQEARRNFAEWGARAEAQGLAFPQISLEAARHPDWPKRNPLKQFVTAWEVDEQNVPHLTFGAVDKAIKPSSIEPWKADLGNGTQITILNPVAHALCYALRVPSGIKRKDKTEIGVHDDWVVSLPFSKISLVRGLARQTIAEGLQEGVDYNVIFREWADYIEALAKKPDFLTKLKGIVTGLYWNTIGTEVAHGKGIFRVLSKTSDKLTGQ